MNIKSIFIKALPHLLALLVMTTASVVYFYPQLEGKVVSQGDIVSSAQAGGEVEEYSNKTGKAYKWTNSQFGGMPKMMWVQMKYNKILKLYDIFRLGFDAPIGMYLALMIFAYALFFFLSKNTIISVGLAIATSLNTSSVILWNAGHYSKISTLVFTPLILLAAILIFEKKYFKWGGILLTASLAASLTMQHPQMTYYIFMFFLVFGVVYLVYSYLKKDLNSFFKGAIVSIIAAALALGITSTRVWSVYDYSKYTIRGNNILKSDIPGESASTGLDWDYVNQWSNDAKDLVACYLVPGFVGGGSGEKVSTKSESFRKYRIKNAPLYWGNLPFTEGPNYMGVTIFYLFVLGLFLVKGPLKWWMGIGVLLMSIFSMGKNFEFINRILFDYMPMYDKFRAPQSIFNSITFYLPVLGILAVMIIVNLKKDTKKNQILLKQVSQNFLIATALVILPIILLGVIGPGMLSFEGSGDARYAQQDIDLNVFISDRKSLLRSDCLRSVLLILGMAGSIWYFIKKSMSSTILLGILAFFIMFDIWGVSKRYVDSDDFIKPAKVKESVVQARAVDNEIKSLETNRFNYRVQDLTVNTYNTSSSSYFHNTIGGYDPAKLRRFQDVIEKHINQGNMNVYNMLNTKYFIVNGDNGPQVRINNQALGNAWFVQEIKEVNTPNEEIESLKSIDPQITAILLAKEFNLSSKDIQFTYDPNASIEIVDYEPTKITYRSDAQSDQFAVFSEIWYNGNRDWISYIDGVQVDHLRVNYILRGMKVPKGKHDIVFEFAPIVYARGETISLLSSIIFLLILLFALYQEYKGYKSTSKITS